MKNPFEMPANETVVNPDESEFSREIEPEEMANERKRFGEFAKREEAMSKSDGGYYLDVRHGGTYEDQRRLEQLIQTRTEELPTKSFSSPESQERFEQYTERLKEAASNNKAFIEARLSYLKPQDRENFLGIEADLSRDVSVAERALEAYDKSDDPDKEPRFVSSEPNRQKLINEMVEANKALLAHENTLRQMSRE